MDGFYTSTKTEDMNIDLIYGFLVDSYWSKDVPRKVVEAAITNSLCFGVYTDQGEQVGFARLITDRATFAYLADVFVLDAYRGRGLSKWLLQQICSYPSLQGLRRIVLATADAHGLYEKFGFTALAKPDIFMERWVPDIYSKAEQ